MLMELTNETKCAKWNNIADDKKTSRNPNDILQSTKNFYTKETNV